MNKLVRIRIGIIAVLVVGIAIALLFARLKPQTESKTPARITYEESDVADIILEKEVYSEKALVRNGAVYIPFHLVEELFNQGFYNDEDENDLSLTYVLPEEIIRIYPNLNYHTVNGELVDDSAPIYISDNGVYYMDIAFFTPLSKMTYKYYEKPNRVVIHYMVMDFLYYETVDDTPFHVEASVTSNIYTVFRAGTKLYYIAGYGNGRNEMFKVMTEDGIYGYVKKVHLNKGYHASENVEYTEPKEVHVLFDGDIKMGWFYVAVKSGNGTYDECIRTSRGMNVISPTWFELADNDGGIKSLADINVVNKAHDAGMKVWILVSFMDGEVSPHQNLSRNVARDKLIENLINETLELGADGINIDFENLSKQTGVHFTQFIKELAVRCHQSGLTLSVDYQAPIEVIPHYDIAAHAKFADYVVLMAYDEHYASSSEAGSVASINFVKNAIEKASRSCEPSRIITGIPFYTRVWRVDTEEVSSTTMTLSEAKKYVSRNKIDLTWDTVTCQNYAEYKLNGAKYKLWLEDESSIAAKIQVTKGYGAAGIACWRLGYETRDVWEMINNYLE